MYKYKNIHTYSVCIYTNTKFICVLVCVRGSLCVCVCLCLQCLHVVFTQMNEHNNLYMLIHRPHLPE